MKVLVIGTGSIGERHLANLQSLGQDVWIYDVDQAKAQSLAGKYQLPALPPVPPGSPQDFSQFSLVLICTPTHTHVPIAKQAASQGCHLFIEKPVAERSSPQLEDLEKIADTKKLITLVGCNMRFHPGIQEIKSALDAGKLGKIFSVHAYCGHYLPNWRAVDYRTTYSAKQKEGGGILLECIHEFDYLYWLFGEVKEVFARAAKQSALEIDSEDVAEVLLTFRSGLIAHLHVDYLQQTKQRGCEIIGERGTLSWRSLGKGPEEARVEFLSGNDKPKEITPLPIDPNQPYLEEMKYLLAMVEKKQATMNKTADQTMNPISQAAAVLRLVEAARESAIQGKVVLCWKQL